MTAGTARLSVVALCVIVAGACNSQLTESQNQPIDPQLAAVGIGLYQAQCAECHGTDLRGTDQGPSHLSAIYNPNHHADGAYLLAVIRGVRQHHWNFGDMPPIDGLETSDVDAIVAYVRTVQAEEGLDPYPP